jgi:hypothetical protein
MEDNRSSMKSLIFISAGVVLVVVLLFGIMYLRHGGGMGGMFGDREMMLQLVSAIRVSLATASEAEKSAVASESDQDSVAFSAQARSATSSAERSRTELAVLLGKSGTGDEKELLARFTNDFSELKKIEESVLDLAVKNTNDKAFRIAFGPATEAVNAMDEVLSRLISANSAAPRAAAVAVPALKVRAGIFRIQSLLAPHISEADDKKMDALEAKMAMGDSEVAENLAVLDKLANAADRQDIKALTEGYAKFAFIRKEILALSRENTDVRSLAISLDRKRKLDALCQDTLEALQQAVQQSLTKWKTSNPREMTGPR